ncbi:MAG: hypothetical protein R2723_01090 [Microbacterium sp.]
MASSLRPPLTRRSPEEVGIPSAALVALAERLHDEGLDPHALLVARGGEVVFETARAPCALDRPALVYSASKTFTSLAIGFLPTRAAVVGCLGREPARRDPAARRRSSCGTC